MAPGAYLRWLESRGSARDIGELAQELTVTETYLQNSGTYDANGQTTTVDGTTTLNGGIYYARSALQTFGGLTINAGDLEGASGNIAINGNVHLLSGMLTAP